MAVIVLCQPSYQITTGKAIRDSAKPLSKCIYTTDPAIQETAKFAALETAGCRWPPAEKKENSISAKSFKTEAKCIVKEYSGHTIMSFENGGHTKRLGGKAIGTQFGNNGNYSVNGERVSSWRKYNQNLELRSSIQRT